MNDYFKCGRKGLTCPEDLTTSLKFPNHSKILITNFWTESTLFYLNFWSHKCNPASHTKTFHTKTWKKNGSRPQTCVLSKVKMEKFRMTFWKVHDGSNR